ncbi:nicotinamide adenine dinucleotide transporter 2, mitochondrial isoform X4 [Sorghum bicolor]|uniref:nicotinamide adenine dinucleotide transporter 2, mitochondrial isoform X4 n=1 Tax=Sorghum bicolor TaxID=4558 RepID=UPI000B4248EE|nr:nicotinamide adenine dinucleotide transporter 2, mitochondrial isoform X4 [Sorghum bicolor]|eukprot:XP_021313093.1 nicotinamide adenine dinucleotide transporter 2, mitochondrial isoform X4 [Sorghum bicolor]
MASLPTSLAHLRLILKNEGLPGLYRGLSPTIVALFPTWAVTFSVYNHVKGVLHSKDGELSVQANVLAASCAGIATATATNPLWVVKTRLQVLYYTRDETWSGALPKHLICFATDCKRRRNPWIVQSAPDSFLHDDSGLLPSLVGVAHVAIQLPVYEKVKLYFARRDNTTVYNLSPTHVAICSSGSKVAASIITYPHEVVRSKLQEQGRDHHGATRYSGVADCIKQVYQKEGFPGFYRGCATNLLRTTPNAVITFTSYEMINRLMHQLLAP